MEALTARELEVLRLLAADTTNQRIAGELVVTLDTIKRQPRPRQARRRQPHRGRRPGAPAWLIR